MREGWARRGEVSGLTFMSTHRPSAFSLAASSLAAFFLAFSIFCCRLRSASAAAASASPSPPAAASAAAAASSAAASSCSSRKSIFLPETGKRRVWGGWKGVVSGGAMTCQGACVPCVTSGGFSTS